MSIRRAALKGTALVGAGRMLDRGLQFGRNIIVARLLSPEDFGIAALFAMTISLLEMISNLAVGTLLIQSPRGDEPEFQQTSQLMMVVRGFLLGAVIFLFAGPVARLFDVPQSAWAFRLLAVVPMIRGLAHTDIIRMQRQMNFKPSIVMDVSSQLFSFVFAWPLASLAGELLCHSLSDPDPDPEPDGDVPFHGGALLSLDVGAATCPPHYLFRLAPAH